MIRTQEKGDARFQSQTRVHQETRISQQQHQSSQNVGAIGKNQRLNLETDNRFDQQQQRMANTNKGRENIESQEITTTNDAQRDLAIRNRSVVHQVGESSKAGTNTRTNLPGIRPPYIPDNRRIDEGDGRYL